MDSTLKIFWPQSLPAVAGSGFFYPLIAFLIATLLTPFLIRWASKHGFLDRPGFRKVHSAPKPRLGGIAIFLGTWIAWGVFVVLNPNLVPSESENQIWALFIASTAVWCLGVFDDLVGANAWKKIIVQVIAGIVVVYFGIKIEILNNPFNPGDIFVSPLWTWVLSLTWIVVVTNAINLIDGLDGLATGVCTITCLTLFFIAKDLGRSPHLPFLLLILSGACLGFLIFNFSPARIFLGDSGSLFLGFMLACLTISGTSKRSAAIVMFGPPLILALPMADVLLAIVRRVRRRVPHTQPFEIAPPPSQGLGRIYVRFREIFRADQEHIHHALLQIGLSHRRAVIILYIVTAVLGASAYSVTLHSHLLGTLVVFAFLSGALYWLRRKFRKSLKAEQDRDIFS